MKTTLFSVLVLLSAINLKAQNVYRTSDGHIIVTGEYNGKKISAQSSKLRFLLDYTTKLFTGKIDLKTLKIGVIPIDSLMLATKDSLWLTFSGTIPDGDFIDKEHPVLKLNVPVKVNANNIQRELVLTATLEHSELSGTYSCSLSGFIELNISQFNFKEEGLKDTVNVQFVQLILEKQ